MEVVSLFSYIFSKQCKQWRTIIWWWGGGIYNLDRNRKKILYLENKLRHDFAEQQKVEN